MSNLTDLYFIAFLSLRPFWILRILIANKSIIEKKLEQTQTDTFKIKIKISNKRNSFMKYYTDDNRLISKTMF